MSETSTAGAALGELVHEDDLMELLAKLTAVESTSESFRTALLARLDRFETRIPWVDLEAAWLGDALREAIDSTLAEVDADLVDRLSR